MFYAIFPNVYVAIRISLSKTLFLVMNCFKRK